MQRNSLPLLVPTRHLIQSRERWASTSSRTRVHGLVRGALRIRSRATLVMSGPECTRAMLSLRLRKRQSLCLSLGRKRMHRGNAFFRMCIYLLMVSMPYVLGYMSSSERSSLVSIRIRLPKVQLGHHKPHAHKNPRTFGVDIDIPKQCIARRK